jgi:4-carboxymuconolactone decarboxylase
MTAMEPVPDRADDAVRARAMDMWERVMGSPPPPNLDDDFTAMTAEHVFGTIWSRPGLGTRERRLVTLTCATLLGATEPLKTHLRAALATGDLDVAELREVAIHLAHYGGWPAGAVFYSALRAVQDS